MNLTFSSPQWDSADAKQLRDFLQSEVGGKVLAHLSFESPSLLDGSDVNMTLVASGVVRGYGLAIETLFKLTVEEPKSQQPAGEYPSLDDETQWADTKPKTTP